VEAAHRVRAARLSDILQGPGTVVVLTGPSSAGKTSIAEQVRRRTTRPAIFLDGDDLDLPEDSAAVAHLRQLPLHDVAPMEAQFHVGYFEALAAFANAGLHAIGEVLLKDAATYERLRAATAEVPSLTVVVRCDLDTRRRREQQRGDRQHGTVDWTTDLEWTPPDPDLTLDTQTLTPEQAADEIVRRLEQPDED
jgi:chloramphenicol 3-O-phosphotransferase